MRNLILGLLICVMALAGVATAKAQPAAYPPCGDYQYPGPSSFCRPLFIGGETLRLRAGIPFAWLRAAPQSPAIVATVLPSADARLQVVTGSATQSVWDGYQWWWQVSLYPNAPGTVGWVEQASLQTAGAAPVDPTVMAPWSGVLPGQLKAGVPFAWLRLNPSSTSPWTATIPAGANLLILGSPSFDGAQWWWRVGYLTPWGPVNGYVEQSSLVALAGY